MEDTPPAHVFFDATAAGAGDTSHQTGHIVTHTVLLLVTRVLTDKSSSNNMLVVRLIFLTKYAEVPYK